ncbi:MAG TPA: hypothetical protein VD788_02575, partial [Candidatus Polarisedimenticolaceae bacterium]|nr:hypothetical protein [Candidatus Polarisedimenticolaceae bacterium]
MRSSVIVCAALLAVGGVTADEPAPGSGAEVVRELSEQAARLAPFVESAVARRFLAAAPALPPIEDARRVHFNESTREAVTPAVAAGMSADALRGFEPRELDGRFYYFTRYGTPLAFVRALDLLGRAGLDGLAGARLVDFGFGSIGHLRMMASSGAEVVGIEVDPLLEALYADPTDVGRIPPAGGGGDESGRLELLFGRFPADGATVERLGTGYDVFVSKNTLKRGYIHPDQPVDPARLVRLDVDDERFVRAVHALLEPGGLFLIYNLYPPQADDPASYRPWADGRSPFSL